MFDDTERSPSAQGSLRPTTAACSTPLAMSQRRAGTRRPRFAPGCRGWLVKNT